MTAKSFKEWFIKECPPGTVISDPEWWAPRIERQVRAALLADRPDVAGLVEKIDRWDTHAPFTPYELMCEAKPALESLAAQLAEAKADREAPKPPASVWTPTYVGGGLYPSGGGSGGGGEYALLSGAGGKSGLDPWP